MQPHLYSVCVVGVWISRDVITVSAHIERHSWLERQEVHFGLTMGVFLNFLSKSRLFLDKNLLKMTFVHSLKILNFDRMSE